MSDSFKADPTGSAPAPAPLAVDDGLAVVRAGNDDYNVEARGTFTPKDAEGYLPSPESDQLRVHVEETFEGPLDLLLFLIEKHALDILDIPIKVVVAEYMQVIDSMRDLNLDVAGEFLVMAAQLAHIKSKMLLPKEERPKEPEREADPRADLVRRLLEYQRFKDAAARLDALPHLGRDVFPRPLVPAQYDGPVDEPVDPGLNLAEVDPFDLIRLYDGILRRQQKVVVHEVLVERISVGARIAELVDVFLGAREREAFSFVDIVDGFGPRTRRGVIVCFLSVLEMARLRLVRLSQDPDTLAIHVLPVHGNLRGEDDDVTLKDTLANVDEFDGAGAEPA
jgi:segregation and condensation protein A